MSYKSVFLLVLLPILLKIIFIMKYMVYFQTIKFKMSSGFISENELAEKRRCRQEEWEKVRRPDQPLEAPEEEYDHRSLFERLQEQKQKREFEYEEAHRLKHMIKGLDDDEVEFLDLVDRSKLEEERKKSAEEAREMADFRNAVASLQEQSLEQRIQQEIKSKVATVPITNRFCQYLIRNCASKCTSNRITMYWCLAWNFLQ
ncbi:PSME3-interacting protein isoform X4 [Lycorma delicatula]|uniref:PSME3-interacting protein isoform X4 n=1 Tax=Lycorma delicatula TaxID=130591 RepID=UPI003F5160E7